mgnify:CR=1 FL=1
MDLKILKKNKNMNIDYIKSLNYVEYSFSLPINSVFYEKWDEDNLVINDKIINEIASILQVKLNKVIIENSFWNETNNVEVFHGNDSENFIFFDLIRDEFDQCDMCFLGVRLNKKFEKIIFDLMLSLYYKTKGPCSNLEIDFYNQSLFRMVFNEDFYFYKNEKNKMRKLNHHNLMTSMESFDFDYAYVNIDGTVRELTNDEKEYLKEIFHPNDGGRPYIKSSYEQLTPDHKISGFIKIDKLPEDVIFSK